MKVASQEDTPAHLQQLMAKVHENADETFHISWDRLCCDAGDIKNQWHGDDMLSAANTLISHLISEWLRQMYNIAQQDDTGYDIQDLFDNIFNGVLAMIPRLKKTSIKLPLEKNEFKRI